MGVLGADGKMGAEVCRAVAQDQETELAAKVDPVGGPDGPDGLDALVAAGVQVAVDFTHAQAAIKNAHWCIEHGIHLVVGTTGITGSDLVDIGARAEAAKVGVFVAPNFAIGAVLMIHFAQVAAAHMHDAEIIELHNPAKLDAPSGTALRTAESIAQVTGNALPTIHSVRLPGLVAHQEVIFGGTGQTLTIRHDSTDRTSFMPGVLLAIKKVASMPGLTVGLDTLLDI